MQAMIRTGRWNRPEIREDMSRALVREAFRLIRQRQIHGSQNAAILEHYDTRIETHFQLLERLEMS
ncbi:MAG: hypothetical protein D6758_05120 [Gammaproteobacteria bacterium]|nr:MAG: hypothetical protein D6758_05120 [Gammaproteobacteria bacterium]